tara:strand:- start:8993 stop:9844 length:852 start_codon:yes stop_codon:yes gene_type:complete
MTDKRIAQSRKKGKAHFIAIPFQLECSKGKNSEVEAAFEWMKMRSLNVVPAQRELAARWGWTLYKVRQFCLAMEEWYVLYASKGVSITNQSQINQDFGDDPQDTDGQLSKSIKFQSVSNHSQSETPTDGELSEPYKQYKLINNIGVVIRVQSTVSDELLQSSHHPNSIKLISKWLEYYEAAGYTFDCILAQDLGTTTRVCREGLLDEAMVIVEWCFTATTCGRAKWRRENGYINLYSLLGRDVFAENLQKARNWKNKPQPTPTEPTTKQSTTTTTTRIKWENL